MHGRFSHIKIALLLFSIFLMFSSISPRQAELNITLHPSDNYYSNMDQYYRLISDNGSEHEGHELKQFRRDVRKWWPRLAPTGSISAASKAINAYNCGYNYTPSKYQPNWTCVGPTGKPKGASYTGNGQMHRITFDPNYDGIHNHTIYSVSNFGGVWKSTTEKVNWFNLNTDKYLPFTTVADIAVHPKETDVLLIATGDGDYGRIFEKTHAEVIGIKIGPTQTSGVYRSINGGTSWHKINGPGNDFCNNFTEGGNTRKLIINPYKSDHAYIATTKGIYRSTNILDDPDQVNWTQVLTNDWETEFRGLAIKPDGIGNTIYASGSEIYKSTDGGSTWRAITTQKGQANNGLDLNDLPYGMNNCRINITTTPADPDRLYAYIYGDAHNMSCEECKVKCKNIRSCQFSCNSIRCWGWIYMYKNGRWHKVNENNRCSIIGTTQRRWLGIAASPVNPNNVYFGTTNVVGNSSTVTYDELLSGDSFKDLSGYNSTGLHADVHELAFEPKNKNQAHPRLYAATHGGISYNLFTHLEHNYERFGSESRIQRAIRSKFKKNWKRIDKGLSVATINDMDQSYFYPEQLIVALQDNGVLIQRDDVLSDTSKWVNIMGGDGYAAMFDANTNNAWADNGKIQRINYKTKKKKNEHNLIPDDPRDGFRSYTRKFIARNHPQTGKLYTAFAELYERKINIPKKNSKKEEVWKLKSDIGKIIGMGWERNIGDFQFSESDPNYMYVISSGVESTPPQNFYTEPRLFRTTNGGCNGVKDYGDPKSDINCFELIKTDKIETVIKGEKRLPMMKSIAVHNTNPDQVWVAFSGYDPNIKVLKWTYDPNAKSGTWTNADPYNTLNNLPVNFIIHQKGTDNRLYIGTDAGVWVKEENADVWERYGDFPNVRVTFMKANYCNNSLIVGTWGRSAWAGDMLPMIDDYENALMIEPGRPVFWTRDRVLDKNLIIKNGAVLKIDSAMISMPYNGKIIIEPEGILSLNNSTIKNNCGESWQGIVKLKEDKMGAITEGRILNQHSFIKL